jgi:bacteriocin-like protein
MNAENEIPRPNDEQEKSSDLNEVTDEDLEQISGGITPIPIPDAQFKPRGTLSQQADLIKGNLNNIAKGGGSATSH